MRAERPKPELPPAPEPLEAPVFDAHCHLDAMAERSGREPDAEFVAEVLAAARAVGVTRVITVGDTLGSSRWCVQAAHGHPDVYAAVAVHPTEIDGLDDAGYAELAELAADDRVVAVGETGLDYYWDRTEPAAQQEHFRRHLALAEQVGKPVMIHDRDAHADVLRILREERAPAAGTVFHSFSGDAEMAAECVEAGYVLSFSGIVTFGNAPALREAAAVTPIGSLLVETDAPFLTPHPYRGRPNSPVMVPLTLRAVAEVTRTDVPAAARGIEATGRRLFGWE
ncbi:MAG: TatD family hydrolase [Jatrophihabitans sp.]